jgi:hypothetical protein
MLTNEIKTLYRCDSSKSEELIEKYLEERLKASPVAERQTLLELLAQRFRLRTRSTLPFQGDEISRLFSLLLGKKVPSIDLSSPELVAKLSSSLNTIFDSLNQIVRVIHTTLLGEDIELDTIRQIISSDLQAKEGRSASLVGYLDQVRRAFLVAHEGIKQAAHTKMAEILTELDPDHFPSSSAGALKFGPLRKAELFDTYKEKFSQVKGWFESGRFMEELLREFEKTCHRLYSSARKEGGE